MADLQGRVIVTLEGRMPSALAGLIERHGGKPLLAPAMREVPLPGRQEVIDFISDKYAGIAQLVERNLAKVEVTSSNLVTRSKFNKINRLRFPILPNLPLKRRLWSI